MFILFNLLALYVIEHFLVLIHEFGHAAIAAILRFKIFSIQIGYGKRLANLKLLNVPISFHTIPFIGLTRALPKSKSWIRLRLWLYSSGGLMTHFFFLSISILIFPEILDPRTTIYKLTHEFAPMETFVVANLLLVLTNIIPRKLKSPTGTYNTDGYSLLTLPFMKESVIEESCNALPRVEAVDLLQRGEYEKAREIYESELAKTPNDNLLIHDLAIIDLNTGAYERSRELFISLLVADEFQKSEVNILLMNNIAWTAAVIGKEEYLQQADEFSQKAFDSAPTFANFIGTRGTVLIRLNRNREGIELLKKSYKYQSTPEARAAEACFIAIGEAKENNFKDADKWLKKANDESPNLELIELAKREVEEIRIRHEGPLDTPSSE
jgi:hypothetical protein